MALTGTLKTYTQEPHPTETQEVTITYPNDETLGDKSGITETIIEPKLVEVETIHENVYVIIKSYFFYKMHDIDMNPLYHLDLHYGVFNSIEDYNNDPEAPAFVDDIIGQVVEGIDENTNLRVRGYELLKTQKGFENLIDA